MRILACLLSLILAACVGHPQDAATEAGAPAAQGDELWRSVDFTCTVDADCEIKNLGNCCGYYPACVNRDSPTFPERVREQCEAEGLASVCGFPELSGCTCVEGRCTGIGQGQGRLD
jgi:hypothetical protein